MKKFISNTSLFISLMIFVLLASFFLNKLILNYLYEKEAKLPNATKWLAVGDSHITNSINPENYKWIQNRAHSGEKLLYNYEKIKYYVENNPNIEVVIIGYWFGSLSYDLNWVHNGKDAKYRYESYLPLMFYNNTNTEYLNIHKNRTLYCENYLGFKFGYPSPSTRLAVKNFFTFNNNLEMRGGFLKAKLKYKNKNIKIEKDTTRWNIDALPLKNLKNIIYYLKSKNIKVVFYNTPNTDEFYLPLNEYNIKLSDSVIRSYVDQKSVFYVDYSRLKLPDSLYNDKHHLNFIGANFMTPKLIDTINVILKNDYK